MKKLFLASLIFLSGIYTEITLMSHTLPIKKIIDLTHTLTPEIPTWDGSCGFDIQIILDYNQCASETKFKLQALNLKKSGTGTHIDSPSHCFPTGQMTADLPLEQLVVKAYVIDVSLKADADYVVSIDDIISFEKYYGKIEENSLVIVYTGWSRYWNDAKKYRNEDHNGIMHFPAISNEAAQLLIERDIAGIAIDTLSPDCPDSGYPVHRLMLGQNKYIIENIAQADQLPPINSYVIALPLKINATESPLRIIGLLLKD